MESEFIQQIIEVIRSEVIDKVKPKEWMDINEASKYLGMTVNTIYKYVSGNKIPFRKIPGSNLIRFRKKHLDAWMESKGKISY